VNVIYPVGPWPIIAAVCPAARLTDFTALPMQLQRIEIPFPVRRAIGPLFSYLKQREGFLSGFPKRSGDAPSEGSAIVHLLDHIESRVKSKWLLATAALVRKHESGYSRSEKKPPPKFPEHLRGSTL
jgi:hypothetical protein